MASAALRKRQRSAYAARVAAKTRRQKIFVGIGLAVLAVVLAYEVPNMLKLLNPPSSTVASPTPTPTATPPRASSRQLSALLRRSGSGVDPFAARPLVDGDPDVGDVGGGRDPFTDSAAPIEPKPAQPQPLPGRIVIGRPGGDRVATKGWIVILASIPTGNGRGDAVRFARRARSNVGGLSILNSSHRRPLRGGYWVVYTGPYATQAAVGRRAATVHAAGYGTAYIRELIRYR
jgi:hypothetical protein